MGDTAGGGNGINFLCQRCQQPLRLSSTLYSMDEHTLAELSLPISPAQNIDVESQAASLDRLVLAAKFDSEGLALSGVNGNGFTLVGESTQASAMSHKLKKTAALFDMLSDNSSVDHPLCEECTDTLLQRLEQQLEQAEQDSQQYQEYLTKLSNETEDQSQVAALEEELNNLMREEQQLVEELRDLKEENKIIEEELEEQGKARVELERQEEEYWRQYSGHKQQLLLAEDEYRSLDCQLRHNQDQLNKLKKTNVFNATFHIWHSGHFGTINGFRLGRLPSIPVDWNELNTAWGQTVLLLYSLVKKIKLQLQRYKLVPYGNYSYIKVLADEKDLPLYGSGGFRLIWDTKFDAGMVAFLDCLQQFKEEMERGDSGFCLPYEMEKGRIWDKAGKGQGASGTVKTLSVKTQFNSEEDWTKAMKYMLTNLKWGLAWVSKRYTD